MNKSSMITIVVNEYGKILVMSIFEDVCEEVFHNTLLALVFKIFLTMDEKDLFKQI